MSLWARQLLPDPFVLRLPSPVVKINRNAGDGGLEQGRDSLYG